MSHSTLLGRNSVKGCNCHLAWFQRKVYTKMKLKVEKDDESSGYVDHKTKDKTSWMHSTGLAS